MKKIKELKREMLLDYWIGLLSAIIGVLSIVLFHALLPYRISFIFTVIDVVIIFCVISYFFTDASKIENEIDKKLKKFLIMTSINNSCKKSDI